MATLEEQSPSSPNAPTAHASDQWVWHAKTPANSGRRTLLPDDALHQPVEGQVLEGNKKDEPQPSRPKKKTTSKPAINFPYKDSVLTAFHKFYPLTYSHDLVEGPIGSQKHL